MTEHVKVVKGDVVSVYCPEEAEERDYSFDPHFCPMCKVLTPWKDAPNLNPKT